MSINALEIVDEMSSAAVDSVVKSNPVVTASRLADVKVGCSD